MVRMKRKLIIRMLQASIIILIFTTLVLLFNESEYYRYGILLLLISAIIMTFIRDEKVPEDPNDWLIVKIVDDFKSIDEAIEYFKRCHHCNLGTICIIESIGIFISGEDGARHLGSHEKIKALMKLRHPTNFMD